MEAALSESISAAPDFASAMSLVTEASVGAANALTDTTPAVDAAVDTPAPDRPVISEKPAIPVDPPTPVVDKPVQAAEPADESKDELDESDLDKIARPQNVSQGRWDRIHGGYARERDMWVKPNEKLGGLSLSELIGIDPRKDGPDAAVEAIQRNYDQATYLTEMNADLESGKPDQIGRFLQAHVTKHFPQALPVLADRAIEALKANPEAYAPIENKVLGGALNGLYTEAAQKKARGDKDAPYFEYAVKLLDWHRNGGYRQDHEIKAPDPVDARLQDIERRESVLRQQDETQTRQTTQRWEAETRSGLDKSVDEEVTSALKPIAEFYKDKPVIFGGIKLALLSRAQEAMNKDANWQAHWRIEAQKAGDRRTPEAAEALNAMYRQKLARTLEAHRRSVINEASVSLQAQNVSEHERAKEAANRKEPGGTGVPVQRSITNLDKVKAAGTFDEAWAALTQK